MVREKKTTWQKQSKKYSYGLMASEVAGKNLCVIEFNSFIRGYHADKEMWEPALGDVLRLEREITSVKDKFANK